MTEVKNFEDTHPDDINICFTSIQQLHLDMETEKENTLTLEHFADKKIVLLADEEHHLRANTQAQMQLLKSWKIL